MPSQTHIFTGFTSNKVVLANESLNAIFEQVLIQIYKPEFQQFNPGDKFMADNMPTLIIPSMAIIKRATTQPEQPDCLA